MPLSIPTLLSLCILLSIPTLPLFLLFRLIPTILRFFIRDMPTYPVRQMLVLHRRTEDLLAFLPGTEVQTLQPVMNSAGHQFRSSFPYAFRAMSIYSRHPDPTKRNHRHSNPMVPPRETYASPSEKTTSDSHRFASGFDGRRAVQVGQKKAGMLEALGSSPGMPAGRGPYLFHCGSFGNEMGEPPHICLSD